MQTLAKLKELYVSMGGNAEDVKGELDIAKILDLLKGAPALTEYKGDGFITINENKEISTILHAGDNITIDDDGAINAAGGGGMKELYIVAPNVSVSTIYSVTIPEGESIGYSDKISYTIRTAAMKSNLDNSYDYAGFAYVIPYNNNSGVLMSLCIISQTEGTDSYNTIGVDCFVIAKGASGTYSFGIRPYCYATKKNS